MTDLRPVTQGDIDALVRLEAVCFPGDRLTRARFLDLLRRPSAAFIGAPAAVIGAGATGLAGYALILFRRGSRVARLYSIAVDPEARGRGLGRRLMEAAVDLARQRGADLLRLEVRVDNPSAIALYRALGFHDFATRRDYYDDGTDALRFEKALV